MNINNCCFIEPFAFNFSSQLHGGMSNVFGFGFGLAFMQISSFLEFDIRRLVLAILTAQKSNVNEGAYLRKIQITNTHEHCKYF